MRNDKKKKEHSRCRNDSRCWTYWPYSKDSDLLKTIFKVFGLITNPAKKKKVYLLDLFKKEKFITEKYVQQRVLLIFFL